MKTQAIPCISAGSPNPSLLAYAKYRYKWMLSPLITFTFTLKAPRKKCIWKCRLLKSLPCITDRLGIEGNSVEPEQTAPIGAVWTGSTLFAIEASKHFSRRGKQTTTVAVGALRVNSFLASGDFCRLLITFANSLDPDLKTDVLSVLTLIQTVWYFDSDPEKNIWKSWFW